MSSRLGCAKLCGYGRLSVITLTGLLFFVILASSPPTENKMSNENALPAGLVNDHDSATLRTDEFDGFVARYGVPERDDSSAYNSPRPILVSRIIEYHPQNVRIIFYPIGRIGQPPPYDGWRVVGYIDMSANVKISAAEAAERLGSREHYWCILTDLRVRLEREARRRKMSPSAVLDLAVPDWISRADEGDSEHLRLQSAAAKRFGAFAGSDAHRSGNVRPLLSRRLRQLHDRQPLVGAGTPWSG